MSVVLGIHVAEGAFAEPKEGDPEQHGGQEGLKADGVVHGGGHLCLLSCAFIGYTRTFAFHLDFDIRGMYMCF